MTRTEKRERIVKALQGKKWNVSEAARALGVHRQALQRDLREWGGAVALRNAVEAASAATHLRLVAPATGATQQEIGSSAGATQNAEPEDVALTHGSLGRSFAPMEASAEESQGPAAAKSATVVLAFDEWLWLRRRAEREAAVGGDSSVRGAIRALICEAMAHEKARQDVQGSEKP